MKMQWTSRVAMVGVLALSTMAVKAQNNTSAPSVTAANSVSSANISPEMLTETVHEAWVSGGRNEDKFFDTVKQFAQMSAQKRGVALPDTQAAGVKMGNMIKSSARRDPDQLLYAVVDAAVRKTAAGTTATSTANK